MWIGKALGGLVGYFGAGGGLFGILGVSLGVAFGHSLDTCLKRFSRKDSQINLDGLKADQGVKMAFFKAVFVVLGHLAKADGRVSEREVRATESVMDRLSLNSPERKEAIRLFTRGKHNNFDISKPLVRLRNITNAHPDIMLFFLELQLTLAYVDGDLTSPEKSVLANICRYLRVDAEQFTLVDNKVRAKKFNNRLGRERPTSTALLDAYKTLGVSSQDTDVIIKKAYRKLISRNHPDKLSAQGSSAEQIDLAKERTQHIQAAYDVVRSARNQRMS